MRSSPFWLTALRIAAVASMITCLCVAATRAEVVILKDGFVIQGNVRKESTVMKDPATGRPIPIAKDNGFDMVDEGPKIVIFSTHVKQLGEINKETKLRPDYKHFEMPFYGRKANDPLPQGVLKSTTDYDARWFRTIKVAVPPNSYDIIEEQITYIDPYFTYMISPTHLWRSGYRTAEFEPSLVRKLLTTGLFRITEKGMTLLKSAEVGVPDTVVAKLKPLKDRDLLQDVMVKELTKLLTAEERERWLGPILKHALLPNPDLAEIAGQPDAGKRIALAKFMLDAGWLKSAQEDIDQIRTLFPELPKQSKDAFDKLVKDFDNATVNTVIREADLALGAGRYKYAAEVLSVFPEKLAESKQIDDYTKLLAQLKETNDRYETGRRLLRSLLDELTGMDQARPALAIGGGLAAAAWPRKPLAAQLVELVAAGETVLAELHPDSSHRIESFVILAKQAEGEKVQGRVPTRKPEAVLATAVSGWAMGKNGATPDTALALKIWSAREMVLAYQRTDDANTRNKILFRFEEAKPVEIDTLAQIISLLPPAAPENLLARTGTPVTGKNTMPPGIYKRATVPTAEVQKSIPYFVKLPPEYHHGRAYPVLMVLGSPNHDVELLLSSLAAEADRRGYIMVAPDWTNHFGNGWQWEGDDHVYVTAVLREVVKNFCIDNDRVYLMGMGDGGSMALDIGLSHPDLFAGILPFCPFPKKKMTEEYWRNAQALPVFIATGELAGNSMPTCRDIFTKWMPKGYPAMMTVYKGRGVEWYAAEIPVMFDWMSRKKRVSITGVLKLDDRGRQPWATMRRTDNRFYWLQVNDVQAIRLLENRKGKDILPATIQGDVNGNSIRLNTFGVLKCSILLTSDLIDWTKGVTVVINNVPQKGYERPKKLTPSLEELLRDYRERGDRRVLLWGHLDFNLVP